MLTPWIRVLQVPESCAPLAGDMLSPGLLENMSKMNFNPILLVVAARSAGCVVSFIHEGLDLSAHGAP